MRIELYDSTGLLGYAEVSPQTGGCICNGRLFEATEVAHIFTVQENVPNVTLLAVDGTPLPRIYATGGNMPGHDSQGRPLDALPNDMSSLESPLLPQKTLTQLENEERQAEHEADKR